MVEKSPLAGEAAAGCPAAVSVYFSGDDMGRLASPTASDYEAGWRDGGATHAKESSIFDFRRNWQRLTVRPPSNEPVLDGVRALAILWVIVLHFVFFHVGTFTPQAVGILTGRATSWISRGDLGVDLFFVLSGYLMGTILFSEFQQSNTIVFRRFYVRRFLRLIPVYIAAMVIGVYLLHNVSTAAVLVPAPPWGHVENAWANLLYVNNFLTVFHQYMGWCWSLAIEEQFYILLPAAILLFMGVGGGRVRLLILLFGLSSLIRFGIIEHYNLVPPFTATPNQPAWSFFFDTLYDKLYTRFGSLLAGVAGAYVSLYYAPQVKRFFARTWLVGLLSVAAIGLMGHVAFTAMASDFFNHIPRLARELWWMAHRDAFSISTMFLILGAMHSGSVVTTGVRRFLSWKAFYPVAQLSYSLYLVHEMLFVWLFPKTAPLLAPYLGPYGTMAVDSALGFLLAMGIASFLYVTIEQPSIQARRLPGVQGLFASWSRREEVASSAA